MESSEFRISSIGVVRSPVKTRPTDDAWGGVVSKIELNGRQFSLESMAGLQDFSHIQVVFYFHLVSPEEIQSGARHPRSRTDWPKVGIFAQRTRLRPNRLGVSTCRLLRVDGLSLTVLDLDAVDETPVIDLKPYMLEFGPKGDVRQPAWASELMSTYFDPLEK